MPCWSGNCLNFSLGTTTVSNEAELEGDAMTGDVEYESDAAFGAIGLAMCNESA